MTMPTTTQQPYREDLNEDQRDAITQVEQEIDERLADCDDGSDIVNAALFMFASWVPMTDDIAFTPWKEVIEFRLQMNEYIYDRLRPYQYPGNKQPYRIVDPTIRIRLVEDLTHKIIARFCPTWLRHE